MSKVNNNDLIVLFSLLFFTFKKLCSPPNRFGSEDYYV